MIGITNNDSDFNNEPERSNWQLSKFNSSFTAISYYNLTWFCLLTYCKTPHIEIFLLLHKVPQTLDTSFLILTFLIIAYIKFENDFNEV